MAGSQAASFRDQAWFPRSLKECAAGNASLRETFVCHFCGNPFSSFSLFPHLRTCKEKARNLQKKGRRTPIAAPPDVPATSEWREEYNAWARDIVEHQDLLTLCQLCGHGVLQNRMSTHLWKCSVNSREAHAHRHALTRVLAAPFSPYEEKTVDRRPREAQMRSGNPANASRTNTHFHQPLLLSAVEALCRESGEAHGERGRKPGRIRACPRLPTERSKGCTSAQRQTPAIKREDLPPCLRYRCSRPKEASGGTDTGAHLREEALSKTKSKQKSLLFWQTREAEAYLKWFHNSPEHVKKTDTNRASFFESNRGQDDTSTENEGK